MLLHQTTSAFTGPWQRKRAADVEAKLMLKQYWLRQAQTGRSVYGRIVEEGIGVKLTVAIVIITLAMIALATARGGELDLRNTQPFIRSGVLSGQGELRHPGDAGRVHAEEGVRAHQIVVDLVCRLLLEKKNIRIELDDKMEYQTRARAIHRSLCTTRH